MSDLFPGWYPDPEVEDQDRWWNGIGWVDRVLPKGYSEVQISPLSGHQAAPGTAPVPESDSSESDSSEPDTMVPAGQLDEDMTATHDVVVDLRTDDRDSEQTDQPSQSIDHDQISTNDPSSTDRSSLSRRDLQTKPIVETYVAWDGLAYEGQPPEGWHLASDERWWAPDTGPDVGPEADSSTEVESAAAIDPAATIIAPPKARTESDASSFSLPATSYSRLDKLPSAQDIAALNTKKSSWWKRRKS